MWHKIDGVDVGPHALSAESERQFDEWVQRRLSDWSTARMRELDRWLVDEAEFEFVAAVRRAWMRKSLEELGLDPEEPAA